MHCASQETQLSGRKNRSDDQADPRGGTGRARAPAGVSLPTRSSYLGGLSPTYLHNNSRDHAWRRCCDQVAESEQQVKAADLRVEEAEGLVKEALLEKQAEAEGRKGEAEEALKAARQEAADSRALKKEAEEKVGGRGVVSMFLLCVACWVVFVFRWVFLRWFVFVLDHARGTSARGTDHIFLSPTISSAP